ncbi:MAG: NAD-dependent epimerase/dehydratase family protein [Bacteriovoracia bacterium]
MRVFITGGAGFIGTKLANRLVGHNEVLVYDSLHPQVHGLDPKLDLEKQVHFEKGSLENFSQLKQSLKNFDPDIVVHLAAETGTGQSMDEITRYCEVNVQGTANLAEIIKKHITSTKKLLLSSSRAVYGEGPWLDVNRSISYPTLRNSAYMRAGHFTPQSNGVDLVEALPTNSETIPNPVSLYASTKLMQELIVKQTLNENLIPIILRFQNVYGAGQSLNNPYTGVLSIFSKKLLNSENLEIYEDGNISRDFVYVDDVVEAITLGLNVNSHIPTINIGSGVNYSLLEVAKLLTEVFNSDSSIFVSGNFRQGDIRCAKTSLLEAKQYLNWEPRINLKQGLELLAKWVKSSAKI